MKDPFLSKHLKQGEVGLTGEVRPITRVEQRIKEAEKLGFETIYIRRLRLASGC